MNAKKLIPLVAGILLMGCIFAAGMFLYYFLIPDNSETNPDPGRSFQPVAELVLSGQENILDKTPFEAISVINDYAYALTWGGTVYVYDIQDLDEIKSFTSYSTPVSRLDVDNERGLLEVDRYLYVFGEEGMEIIDTQDPERLKIISSIKDLEFGYDNLIRSNDYLLAVGYQQVLIYKLSNSFTPELLTRITISKDINSEDVIAESAAIYKNVLYVSTFYYYKDTGMLLYDIRDISNPVFIGLTEGESAHQSLIIQYKLIQCTPEHVLLWSLDDPSNPRLLSTVDAVGNVCQLVDNNLLLTDGKVIRINENSLQVESEFDYSRNAAPRGSDLTPNFIFITRYDRIHIFKRIHRIRPISLSLIGLEPRPLLWYEGGRKCGN